MLYPESQFKIYSGKLVSLEIELEEIQSKLDRASFIILATAVLTLIYTVFKGLDSNYDGSISIITGSTVLVYFLLWLGSYRNPLTCFIIALFVFIVNSIYNLPTILEESIIVMAYRLSVPTILILGIWNVIYSWYCIRKIKQKEIENPDCVNPLIYVIKENFIYNDQRHYDVIINNIDSVSNWNELNEIILNDSTRYVNYSIEYHVYNKLCQIFVERPFVDYKVIVNAIFETGLRNEIHIYFSMLVKIYGEENWSEEIWMRGQEILTSSRGDKNLLFIFERAINLTENSKIKKDLGVLIGQVKNNLLA